MFARALRSVAVVAACWAFVSHVPDVARYLRMREMSRPAPRPPT